MKNIIGVFNPFGLIQKAGRKKTSTKRKTKKRLHKKHRKTRKFFQFI